MAVLNTYSPVGRPGYYSFETVTIGDTRYTWKPNQNRWEASGGGGYTPPPLPNPNEVERLASGENRFGQYNSPIGDSTQRDLQGKVVQFAEYQFVTKTNGVKARLYIDDKLQGALAPSIVKLSRTQILSARSQRVRVEIEGYTSNTEYEITTETTLGTPSAYNTQGPGPAGLSVVVKKYVNGSIVPYNGTNGSTSVLDFELVKEPIVIKPKLNTFTINLSGPNGSVRATKNGNVSVKIVKGKNTYTDTTNTKFSIVASDGYNIKRITQTESGKKPITITARPKQSLTFNSLFDKANLVVDIETEKQLANPPSPPPIKPDTFTPPTPPPPKITPTPLGPEPKIQLLDSGARTHNINSNTGIPIAFRKNDAVKAVTVFVGTESFEFDNLGNGEVVGIVIPHKAFANIGRYDVKIIPYSLDELDDTITEIRTGKTTRTVERVTTVPVPRPVPVITNRIVPAIPPPIPPKVINTPRPVVPTILPIRRLLPEENFLQSIERGLNTTRTPNIFTDLRDISVRGIGFDDELRMENINGVAQIANTQTNARILNPGAFLVNGTGDLSIPRGRLPGSSVVPIEDPSINTPIENGRGNYTANEQLAARERLLNQQRGGRSYLGQGAAETGNDTNTRQL